MGGKWGGHRDGIVKAVRNICRDRWLWNALQDNNNVTFVLHGKCYGKPESLQELHFWVDCGS